jgi:hypothetical protein
VVRSRPGRAPCAVEKAICFAAPLLTKHFPAATKHESWTKKNSRKAAGLVCLQKIAAKAVFAHNQGGFDMADKRSLGLLGFLFGGLTMAVSLTAFLLVQAHVGGHLQFSDAGPASQVTVGYR